uniref:TNFR-Cys domain-containing protein n=2 Tax=Latimeria chalumnae TaxID=7897 RepID=M3XHJ9_LATCH
MTMGSGRCQSLTALLLLMLVLGELSSGEQCNPNEYELTARQGKKCCKKCEADRNQEYETTCAETSKTVCRCKAGYRCINPECSICLKPNPCKEGEEIVQEGDLHYTFHCKPCDHGKYLDKVNSKCKPWINCTTLGLDTLFPGNTTHNAKCGVYLRNINGNSWFMICVVVLTAVTSFILILMTIFLHLYIWKMKKMKFPVFTS